MLTLSLVTLVNSLDLIVIFVDFLGLSKWKIMTLVNRDSFVSSFPTCIYFISFYWLVALIRTSSMMLNRKGESRHPWRILGRKTFNLSLLCMRLSVGFFFGSRHLSDWVNSLLFLICQEILLGVVIKFDRFFFCLSIWWNKLILNPLNLHIKIYKN